MILHFGFVVEVWSLWVKTCQEVIIMKMKMNDAVDIRDYLMLLPH